MSVTYSSPGIKFTFSISNQSQISSSSSSRMFHNLRFIKKPQYFCSLNTKLSSAQQIITRGVSSGSFDDPTSQQQVSDFEARSSGDEYVGLFISKLGFDNDPLDREQAIDALWKYSLGGEKCIDQVMKSPGLVSLIVNLLNMESSVACEAAAGLLRMISSFNIYRGFLAESGAVQEITGLLRRSSLTPEVKEQSLRVLSNLSVDETLQGQIANSDLLPLLIKFLDDEDMKVIEAAGGVLANLVTWSNTDIMVQAGVVPPLAKFLSTNSEGSKVIRKIAQSVLLKLAQSEYYKYRLLDQGLVLVPLVGAAAYKALKPSLHSLPFVPDGSELNVKQSLNGPSRVGASKLLPELHFEDDKKRNLEESKKNAIAGRTQQQFLARIGAIETEDESIEMENQKFTILPWVDGVARLVLILELEDELAIANSAEAIADASTSEHMVTYFMEAGAVKNLFRLIDHPSVSVRVGVIRALDKLSFSIDVCQRILAEGFLNPLIGSLKNQDDFGSVTYEILEILHRSLYPIRDMESKFLEELVNGSGKGPMTLSFETVQEGDLSDSEFLFCLIEILRTSSPLLQCSAISVLESLTIIETCREKIVSLDIESALDSLFNYKFFDYKFFDEKEDMYTESESEDITTKLMENDMAFLAIFSALQLLARLLDCEHFRKTVNPSRLTDTLRKFLTSKILASKIQQLEVWTFPLETKEWVAACLVKLGSLSGPAKLGPENPINTDVMLYETIPRLIEQIQNSCSLESREVAVLELKKIVCEGVVGSTLAVARKGGIFPLVKAIEDGNQKVVEAALAILYNLSMDAENHAAIVAAGAVPILRRIALSKWRLSVSECSVRVRALRLLRTLPV